MNLYYTCSHSQAIIPLLILELDDELRIGAVVEEEEVEEEDVEEEEVEEEKDDVPFLHPTITPC